MTSNPIPTYLLERDYKQQTIKATTLYLIMEARDDGPPIHHYSTTDEDLAADYIDSRRAAFAESGIPGCPWYYINTNTTN